VAGTSADPGGARALGLSLLRAGRLFRLADGDSWEPGYDCITGMRRLIEAVSKRRGLAGPARSSFGSRPVRMSLAPRPTHRPQSADFARHMPRISSARHGILHPNVERLFVTGLSGAGGSLRPRSRYQSFLPG